MQQTNEEKKELEYIENLNTTLDIAKSSYQDSLDRIKNVESKLNILLVFGAGLLAGLNIILPYPESILQHTRIALNIFLIEFFVSLVVSFICILIGLFINRLRVIDSKVFVDNEIKNKSIPEVLGSYLATYHVCIESIEKHKKMKNIMFVIAFISLLVALVLFISMTIIKIFI